MEIPLEDVGFGFAMITAVLMLWQWQLNRLAKEQNDGPCHSFRRKCGAL